MEQFFQDPRLNKLKQQKQKQQQQPKQQQEQQPKQQQQQQQKPQQQSKLTEHHSKLIQNQIHTQLTSASKRKIQLQQTQSIKKQKKTDNPSQSKSNTPHSCKKSNLTPSETTESSNQRAPQSKSNHQQLPHLNPSESDSNPTSNIHNNSSKRTLSSSSPFSVTHPLEPDLPSGKLTSSSKLVNLNRNSYKIWFNPDPNPQEELNHSKSWPFKSGQDPFVRVLYPSGRHETFPLLIPKSDEDEYRPLDDLLNVITTTLSYYLTPDQSTQYFSEPHPILPFYNSQISNSSDFRFLITEHQSTSTSSVDQSSTTSPGDHPITSSGSSQTKVPQIPVNDPSLDLSSKPLLKSLSKAIRKKNALDFFQLIGWYNRVIKFLTQHDLIKKQQQEQDTLVDEHNQLTGGVPKGIWEIILRQSYERQISTNLEVLQNYETWSSNVYGELRANFVESIFNELIDLKPNQVFVDLGSGIGNIVLQVALQIGCVSVGFEIMDGYSDLAVKQRDEVIGRADKLWNVKLGLPVLVHADFTKDPRVGKWLQQADVVLVNNQVFTPSLNESLTLLFLELKESVKIISLKPFIPTCFKINQRNLDSPLSILSKPNQNHLNLNRKKNKGHHEKNILNQLDPGVFFYPPNSVSWTNNSGKFFITVVDRSKLIQVQNQLLSSS